MREFERALPIGERAGRILEGRALSYDRAYRVSDDDGASFYLEGWRAGAFTRGLDARGNVFELRADHADMRVGRLGFVDSARALDWTATIDDGPVGDAVLEHYDAGRLRAVSLRFESKHQTRERGVIWRTDGVPRELSIVVGARAQYDDALIEARRSLEADPDELAAAAARARRSSELVSRVRATIDRGMVLL